MTTTTSENNSKFWDEMCGSTLAQSIGIKDFSIGELKKFDDEYFYLYPYLQAYFPKEVLNKSKIVEFGLGFGTLSQFLASNAKEYTGVDIAQGPVNIVNHRMDQLKLAERARAKVGSALEMPFESGSVDFLASIGCFHHTGNFPKCIDEAYRILRPGGSAVVMVYNRYSYRRWYKWPLKTLKELLLGKKKSDVVGEDERAAYDTDTKGNAAPETQFYSVGEIHSICKKFKKVTVIKENWSSRYPSIRLKTLPFLGRICGLDLYIMLEK